MEDTPKKGLFRRVLANLVAVTVGCLLTVLLLGAAEGVLRLKASLQKGSGDRLQLTDAQYADCSTPLCFRPKPNITMTDRVTRGARCVYEANYTIDSHSRRVAPCDSPETRERVAAFFGCSFTFGTGCGDDDTLPSRFGAHCRDYRPVNFGFGGYGPQQMWLMLKKLGALDELQSKKGAVVYTFIENHIDRLAGSASILSVWKYRMPWLAFDNGAVKWMGTFNDRMTLQSFWDIYAERLHLVKFIENRMPHHPPDPRESAAAMALMASVLQECGRAVAEAGPDLKFYCVIFPGTPQPCCASLMRAMEGRTEVIILDYSNLFAGVPYPDDKLWYDDSPWNQWGHPKPLGYDIVAAKLAGDIGGCK